jgi:Flp pilus assembly protein TadG
MRRPVRSATGERASASVEFALVLPLVLIMALAVVQVGLLVKDQLIVQECARAGARQASVSADDSSARAAASEAAISIDPDRVTVTIDRQGGGGTPVSVHVAYAAPIVVPLVTWLFPTTVQIAADAVMRQEGG